MSATNKFLERFIHGSIKNPIINNKAGNHFNHKNWLSNCLLNTINAPAMKNYFKPKVNKAVLDSLKGSPFIDNADGTSLLHKFNKFVAAERIQQITSQSALQIYDGSGRNGQKDGVYTYSLKAERQPHYTNDSCKPKAEGLLSFLKGKDSGGVLFDVHPDMGTTLHSMQVFGNKVIRLNNTAGFIPIVPIALSIPRTINNSVILVLDEKRFDNTITRLLSEQIGHILYDIKCWKGIYNQEEVTCLGDILHCITQGIAAGSLDSTFAQTFAENCEISKYLKVIEGLVQILEPNPTISSTNQMARLSRLTRKNDSKDKDKVADHQDQPAYYYLSEEELQDLVETCARYTNTHEEDVQTIIPVNAFR